MGKRDRRRSKEFVKRRESAKSKKVEVPEGTSGEEEVGRELGHVTVLLKEAIQFLNVRRGGTYVDATLGLGGHSVAIAQRIGGEGRMICFDQDPRAIEIARERFERLRSELGRDLPQIELVHAPFSRISERVAAGSADGILADLGVSSIQLDEAARGFSFRADGPLDMRMDTRSGERTAEQVVNHMDEQTLADVIYELGEERRSRRIARAISRARPIRTTAELAGLISAALPAMKRKPGSKVIHPATKTFQAIRMFVNRELEEEERLLEQAPGLLKPGGRLVVISFHSLEDRRVKDHMREMGQQGVYELLTKKPVTAGEQELESNPRSRSAKLRAAQKK